MIPHDLLARRYVHTCPTAILMGKLIIGRVFLCLDGPFPSTMNMMIMSHAYDMICMFFILFCKHICIVQRIDLDFNALYKNRYYYYFHYYLTGHYCPENSGQPTPCPVGQFQNETRQITCKSCPQGFYCPLNTSRPISCPAGHYCQAQQGDPLTNPCPAGTYNNVTERYDVAACLNCPPG